MMKFRLLVTLLVFNSISLLWAETTTLAKQSNVRGDADLKSRIVRLWPIERIGGEQNRLTEDYRDRKGKQQLCGVKDPNITIYPAKSDHPTPAVLYSPGGGYGILGLPDEEHIREWNNLGITLIVLKYTIPKQRDKAFEDIQRAVRIVRHNAQAWNIKPNQIGLFGNSAGGHLSARLMNNYKALAYEPVDEVDKVSCEPDFGVLQCSAYFNTTQPDGPFDREVFPLKDKVAPTFLTYAKDDKHYPGGVNYVEAMNKAGNPIRFKVYETGGHGMKGCDWFAHAVQWLKTQQIVQ